MREQYFIVSHHFCPESAVITGSDDIAEVFADTEEEAAKFVGAYFMAGPRQCFGLRQGKLYSSGMGILVYKAGYPYLRRSGHGVQDNAFKWALALGSVAQASTAEGE